MFVLWKELDMCADSADSTSIKKNFEKSAKELKTRLKNLKKKLDKRALRDQRTKREYFIRNR